MRTNLRPYNHILQSPINVLTYKNKAYINPDRNVSFDLNVKIDLKYNSIPFLIYIVKCYRVFLIFQ